MRATNDGMPPRFTPDFPRDPQRERLLALVREYEKAKKRWAKLWSFVHHGALVAGVFLSAIATLSLAAKWPSPPARVDYHLFAIMLAAGATIVGTLAATGIFAAKSRANANEFTSLQLLRIDAECSRASTDDIRERLKQLIVVANAQFVAASAAPSTYGSTRQPPAPPASVGPIRRPPELPAASDPTRQLPAPSKTAAPVRQTAGVG
jgi:hypothetical protein